MAHEEIEFAEWLTTCCWDAEKKLNLTPIQIAYQLHEIEERYLLRILVQKEDK